MQTTEQGGFANRLTKIERAVEAIRKAAGAASTIISRGGLTLLNDAFLKMVDSSGNLRLLVGASDSNPFTDGTKQQVFSVYDPNGTPRVAVFDPNADVGGYTPVFWVWDHTGRVVLTTDINGGMAEPHISVPLMQRWRDSTFGSDAPASDPTLPISALGANPVCWEGRISKVSHPRIVIDGAWGRVTGTTGAPTYTLEVGGTDVGAWSRTAYAPEMIGPFDIASKLGNSNVAVRLKVSGTGTSSDRIACGVYGCWMRQT